MECRDVRPLIDAFVSEQLLVETTQAIVVHLEKCPACRAEVEGLRRLRAATRAAFASAPELEPRPEFASALSAHLQTQAAQHTPARLSRRMWLAVAASALLIVNAGVGFRQWSRANLAALLEAVVGDHRFCALTFKLAERPIPLEEAARQYGGAYAELARVEPSTPALSGGPLRIVERHSCVFEGRRFAHLVVRYKDEAVSVLVADDDWRTRWGDLTSTAEVAAVMPVTQGFHVASFRGPHHAVFVVSSLSDDDVYDVAQAMASPVSRALANASPSTSSD